MVSHYVIREDNGLVPADGKLNYLINNLNLQNTKQLVGVIANCEIWNSTPQSWFPEFSKLTLTLTDPKPRSLVTGLSTYDNVLTFNISQSGVWTFAPVEIQKFNIQFEAFDLTNSLASQRYDLNINLFFDEQ